jgi:hypothetical protein
MLRMERKSLRNSEPVMFEVLRTMHVNVTVLWDKFSLKSEAECSSETLMPFYQTT